MSVTTTRARPNGSRPDCRPRAGPQRRPTDRFRQPGWWPPRTARRPPPQTLTYSYTATMVVTPEQIESFRHDGAVCVRGAFTPERSRWSNAASSATWPPPAHVRSSPAKTTTAAASSRTSATGRKSRSTARSSAPHRRREIAGRLMGSCRCGSTTTTCWSRSRARGSRRRGTRTSRTTTSTAARRAASGCRSIRCRAAPPWSSSPDLTAAPG